MGKNENRQDKGEMRALLKNYQRLKDGVGGVFIEEDGFEQIADYYIENEHFQAALEAAEMGFSQYPYSAGLLVLRSESLIALRRYQESLFFLEKAEWLDRNEANIYILRTEALLALDRQEEAAALLEAVIDQFEGDEKINLLFELTDVYDDYEDFNKVFDCLRLILLQDPHNEEALYKICFWTDYTGRNEEGIVLHQQIIDENPYSELAWFNLGAAYQGIKLYEKAIDAYEYAVAINEKFDYAYRNIGDAYIRLRKYKEAIEALEKVLVLSMPEAVIYEAIGHCYDKQKNYAQARFNYKKASHLNPEDSQLHYKIAGTYMSEQNWQNAIKSLNIALKFHLLQPEYNLALGRCYLAMENYDEAITFLGNVVRVRPKHTNGWIELLNCLFEAEMFEEGFEYAAMAFENTATKPIFVYYKSAFLFAAGKFQQALIYLEHALKANSKLMKKFVEINPSFLQHQQIVELLARYKKSRNTKK